MRKRRERQEAIRRSSGASGCARSVTWSTASKRHGFDCTQATVSRDIADMGLRKLPEGVYVLAEDLHLQRMISELVTSVVRADNLVLVKASPVPAQGSAPRSTRRSSTRCRLHRRGRHHPHHHENRRGRRVRGREHQEVPRSRLKRSPAAALPSREESSWQREKCVLAYSGGLDTSVAIRWLDGEPRRRRHRACDRRRAGASGPRVRAQEGARHRCDRVDRRRTSARSTWRSSSPRRSRRTPCTRTSTRCVSAMSRPIIVKHLVEEAHRTARGTSRTAAPARATTRCVSRSASPPSIRTSRSSRRCASGTSRPASRRWTTPPSVASRCRPRRTSPYSIDDNLWGRAIECGVLEDPWVEPPADIYTLTADSRGDACDEPEYAEITFEQGLPIALERRGDELPRDHQRDERARRAATVSAAST